MPCMIIAGAAVSPTKKRVQREEVKGSTDQPTKVSKLSLYVVFLTNISFIKTGLTYVFVALYFSYARRDSPTYDPYKRWANDFVLLLFNALLCVFVYLCVIVWFFSSLSGQSRSPALIRGPALVLPVQRRSPSSPVSEAAMMKLLLLHKQPLLTLATSPPTCSTLQVIAGAPGR